MHTVSSQAADSQCPTRAASLPQETEGRSHRRAAYVDGTGSAEGEPERWPSAREGSAGARAPLKVDNPPAGDTSGTQSQRRPRPTLVVALLIQTTVPAPAASGRRRRSLRSGPPPPSPDSPGRALARRQPREPQPRFLRKKEYPDLFEWFCVKTLKVCCLPGTYGPDCLACQGGSERPCSGNGHCSGDGSRQGDGSCQCHVGYQGATCTDCADGYFSSRRNETHSICTACDESCKTCTGPTNRDCSQCAVGWVQEDDACVDVDECAAETPPCGDQQYCENVNGSFVCEECDSTCVGCTGQGPGRCKECIPGYTKESGQCADIDECAGAEKACTRENENCYNTPGSYVCVCPEGFEDTEDACVRTQTLGSEVTEDPTRPPSHEDL
ncbi:LOW QUALITY PROTEIN: protein disulfide isomerase CRELD2 [Ailuropoda melanoleuca]|uniref:LOW QUALITY PROTEIN: protein disulfide isomerase CRELD2 n=1 Tax=Ailuropoda melanoleuca TaxID=9646 RepID=UPI00149457AD|nr:LOW QUALITY PROTEIN: protein disulfide isomerase CRELD2 [Ailuropoda melanoleuca]